MLRFPHIAMSTTQWSLMPKLVKALHPEVQKNFGPDQQSITLVLARKGNILGLEAALENNPQLLTLASDLNVTPLMGAVLRNQVEMVKHLLAKGCEFATPAHQQAFMRLPNRDIAQCKQYINTTDEFGLLPIDYAVASGDLNEVQWWVQASEMENHEINFYQLLKIAIMNSHAHLFQSLIPRIDTDLMLKKPEHIAECFLEANDNIIESFIELIKLYPGENGKRLAGNLIYHLAAGMSEKTTIALLKEIKNSYSMQEAEVLIGHILGCVVQNKKASSTRSHHEKLCSATYVVTKAFAEEFSRNPLAAKDVFLFFFEKEMEAIAFYFLRALPIRVIASIVNSKVKEVSLLQYMIEKKELSLCAFHELLYLGANLRVKNDKGESLEMLIESSSELQVKTQWFRFSAYNEFFNNFFKFNQSLVKFFQDKKFNSQEFQETIDKLVEPKKSDHPIDSSTQQWFVNECLNRFWALLKRSSHENNKKTFLENVYFIAQRLLSGESTSMVDYIFHHNSCARLAYALGNYPSALTHLQAIETHLAAQKGMSRQGMQVIDNMISFLNKPNLNVKKIIVNKDPLSALQLYYSKLMLNMARYLKLKTNFSLNFYLQDVVNSDLSMYLMSDDALLGEIEKTYTEEDFASAIKEVDKIKLITENYKKERKEKLNYKKEDKDIPVSEDALRTFRVLMSIKQGIFLLNEMFNRIEEKLLKKLLSGSTDIQLLKSVRYNEKDLAILREFYLCSRSIHVYLGKMASIQENFLSDPDLPTLDINYAVTYAAAIQRVEERFVIADNATYDNTEKKLPSVSTPTEKNKKNNKKLTPPNLTEDSDEESEKEIFIPGQSGLPTYYPNVVPRMVPTSSPCASVAKISSANSTTLFSISKAKTAAEIRLDKKVDQLKVFGNNHRLSINLLYFLALFEPGEIYVVGTMVNYTIGDLNEPPRDADLLLTVTDEKLNKKLAGVRGVCHFKRNGFGEEYSYSLEFQYIMNCKREKIDITFLSEPGETKEEKLAANSAKRDLSATAMIYDPFASKEKQLYDFYNARAESIKKIIRPLPRSLKNCYEADPKLLLRVIKRLCQEWHFEGNGEMRFQHSIKYLERLSVETLKNFTLIFYQDYDVAKVEAIYIKYKLYEVSNVKAAVEEVKKHPELYAKKASASTPVATSFVSQQRELKFKK